MVPPEDPFVADCFRFTFVRHPCERFASFVRSKIAGRTTEQIRPRFRRLGLRAGMSLEEIFAAVEAAPRETLEWHVMPQSYFVFDGERPRVDFIGHLEQFEAGLDEIAARNGTRLEVQRLNVTGCDPSVQLSPELKARLAKFYAEDFARFGYTP